MTQAQHIIVVDDEQPAREMVGDYLRMHGFTVSLCDGGASLRETIGQQVPDLIVLDLNMPEEDGLSVIRDLKRRTSVPIIMLTATARAIAWSAWSSAPTTTWPSRASCASSWRASARCCAGAAPVSRQGSPQVRRRRRRARGCDLEPSGSTMTPRRCAMTKATSTR